MVTKAKHRKSLLRALMVCVLVITAKEYICKLLINLIRNKYTYKGI